MVLHKSTELGRLPYDHFSQILSELTSINEVHPRNEPSYLACQSFKQAFATPEHGTSTYLIDIPSHQVNNLPNVSPSLRIILLRRRGSGFGFVGSFIYDAQLNISVWI